MQRHKTDSTCIRMYYIQPLVHAGTEANGRKACSACRDNREHVCIGI